MMLPEGFDPDNLPPDAVDRLVATGEYTREQAEDLVALLADDNPDVILQ